MKGFKRISINNLTIMQSIVVSITAILGISVVVAVLLVFNISSKTTRDLVHDQASEINKQIVFNYENYTNRLVDIANLLQKKSLEYDLTTETGELVDLFVTSEELEESIVSIVLFDDSGQVVASTQRISMDSKEVAVQSWFSKASFDDNIIHFSSPHKQVIYENLSEEVISASKAFEYQVNGLVKQGILLIDMNFQGIESLSKVTNLGEIGHILILDAKDSIVYSSDRDIYSYNSSSYKIAKDLIFGSLNANISGNQMVVTINTIGDTRWRIATFQDVNAIEQGNINALYTLIIVVTITMIITIIVAYFVAMQITNPLKKLNKAIARFHHGNDDSYVELQGQKEINTVIIGFNEMIDRIHALMDEVVKEQEGKRKTEIRALQNQINPHFLYNTLDCMIWLAEQNRNEDLVETVGALSTYFRVSLSKGKQFIPIFEELMHIESYMLIQRMRYNDRFEYSIDCSEEVSKIRIMKLILQPLVENAIYHGIDKDDSDSHIKISVKEENAFVVLSVMNTGYGISEEKIEEIYTIMREGSKKGSVGMKNVYRRIKLFYGDEADIVFESELDESTTVSIKIPSSLLSDQGDELSLEKGGK